MCCFFFAAAKVQNILECSHIHPPLLLKKYFCIWKMLILSDKNKSSKE